MSKNRRAFDWYFTVVLATLTFLLLCACLALDILMWFTGNQPLPNWELHPNTVTALGFVVPVMVIAVFWFWVRMLVDFFQVRPGRHAVTWGFALLFLNFVAALAYFWWVWRPRHATLTADA